MVGMTAGSESVAYVTRCLLENGNINFFQVIEVLWVWSLHTYISQS